MSIIKNIQIKEKLRCGFFLNIFTIIILMWMYHPHDYMFTYGSIIENKDISGSSLKICFNRHLAEYEVENKLDRRKLYKNSSYNFENNGIGNYGDYISIYGNMKNSDSKKLKLYKTAYKHRYAKRKGLSKLDCYYENKIFKKMDYIDNLADNWNSDKKSFKKMILSKYGVYIFLILFPLLGLIFPVLFGKIFGSTPLLELCQETHSDPPNTCDKVHMSQEDCYSGIYASAVISLTMSIINIFVIIYILMKIIKYEKLKACKGKMNFKEYCRFCKDIFYNKTN